jgi:Zinc finger, C2H2 type
LFLIFIHILSFSPQKYAGKKCFNKHVCPVKEIKCEFPHCGKLFTKLNGFNSHITKLHKLPKIKRQYCSFCKLSKPTTDEEFKEHSKKCEKNAKLNVDIPVTCEMCSKVCQSQKSLAIHMMFHTTGNKSFNYDDELPLDPSDPNAAKLKSKQRQKGIFICETCGKEFSTKRYLSDHTRRVHTMKEKNPEILTCDHCGKIKKTRYELSKHIRNVHITIPSPCTVCGKVFRNKPLLQAHMIYHKDYKRIHFCPLCPDKPPYVTAIALKRHQESNHGYGNGYHCDICNAFYK